MLSLRHNFEPNTLVGMLRWPATWAFLENARLRLKIWCYEGF